MKILVVDDEKLIRDVIIEYLLNSSYEVDEAQDGKRAYQKLLKEHYDLLILDIMMPTLDGFQLLHDLPKEKKIPTIVLSARSEEFDKLKGFDLGIDDYLTKPFSPKELVARVKAILNRTSHSISTYSYQGLVVEKDARVIKIDGKKIDVTPKEFDVLVYLIENKGIAVSREQLLSSIWGYDFYGEDRTVDTHIKMLRGNLGKYRNHIITVRGIGYKYVEEE